MHFISNFQGGIGRSRALLPSFQSAFDEEISTSKSYDTHYVPYEDLSSMEILFLKSAEKDLDKILEGKVVDYNVNGKKIIPLDYREEIVFFSHLKDGK